MPWVTLMRAEGGKISHLVFRHGYEQLGQRACDPFTCFNTAVVQQALFKQVAKEFWFCICVLFVFHDITPFLCP
jgi:hypothetical protein